MSPVRLIILLVAAGAAVAAVFLIRSVQAPAPAVAAGAAPVEVAKPVEIPTKQVLVANNAIPVGKFVEASDLRWQEWPASASVESFMEQEKAPEALEKMVGAVARFDLVVGEPITASKLVHPGTSGFMAVMLTPGMRAVSVEIAAEVAAGGFIQPNDRVDVIVTRTVEGKAGNSNGMNIRSDLILANIRVLAIDATYGAPPAEEEGAAPKSGQGQVILGSRATLELSERDATLISTAKKAGDISLTLRSVADIKTSQEGATAAGRIYRDGVSQDVGGVRVYRYGDESVATSPAG
jgi:pilus assembly protein CpaB